MATYPGRAAVQAAWNTFVDFYRGWTSNARGTLQAQQNRATQIRKK